MLGTDEPVDALYKESVNDMAYINLNCDKRISDAGEERSAGRPDNRSRGARRATRAPMACLEPHATWDHLQPRHTGTKVRDASQESLGRPRDEDKVNTSQPKASASRRSAAEDRASLAIAVLHPCGPPISQDEETMMSMFGHLS